MSFPLMPFCPPSNQAGDNWRIVQSGGAYAYRKAAVSPSGVWVFTGGSSAGSRFFRSADFGATITSGGISSVDVTGGGVAYGAGVFVVSAYNGNVYYSSSNGSSITQTTPDIGPQHAKYATFNDGYFVLSMANNLGNDAYQWGSSTGISGSWTKSNVYASNEGYIGIYAKGKTVAIGASVYRYKNGTPVDNTAAWTPCTGPITGTFQGMCYSSPLGVSVAVGSGGIYRSTDMIAWSKVNASAIMQDVAWCSNGFIAVGNSGTILTSSDGITWTQKVSGITANIYGIASYNGVTLAFGSSGYIIRSDL